MTKIDEDEITLRGRISEGSHDPEDFLNLTQLLVSENRDEEAIAVCENALTLPLTKLQSARVFSELGWVLYVMARREEAIQSAQSALRLLPEKETTPESLLCKGRSYSVIAFCEWASKGK